MFTMCQKLHQALEIHQKAQVFAHFLLVAEHMHRCPKESAMIAQASSQNNATFAFPHSFIHDKLEVSKQQPR